MSQIEGKVRYTALIGAEILIASKLDEKSDLETARYVLEQNLKQIEGDASLHTAIDSNLKFNIDNIYRNKG